VVGGAVLIALGLFFLYANLGGLDPLPLLSRYWPVLLILLGLGKLWDYFWLRSHPEARPVAGLTGVTIAAVVFFLLLGVAAGRGVGKRTVLHEVESVPRGTAESVHVQVEMGAGELRIAGGAKELLEATFDYSEAAGKPRVAYEASGTRGELSVTQPHMGVHVGRTHNEWDLRLNNEMPMELNVEMGAGQGDLILRDLSLTKLDIQLGAGQLTADLTGDWKKDVDVNIEGGVGSATIRLPGSVGVRVNASGGIGSINVRGLKRDGDAYVNDAYGKSPVTLRLSIEGGIGEINLVAP